MCSDHCRETGCGGPEEEGLVGHRLGAGAVGSGVLVWAGSTGEVRRG